MAELDTGAMVAVPCTILSKGPLRDLMVSIETERGVISGFIREDFVMARSATEGVVLGKIVETRGESVMVQLPGSFFTTAAGMAFIQSKHLSAA